MSLELVREAIKVNQVIGSETAQTVVDSDIIVPDVKPDIARILLMDGDVSVNSTEVIQDKVLVNGTIDFKILYVPEGEEQSIKSINNSTDFSYGLDVPNAGQGMKSKVKCDVEHIEYEILNGRKVNAKTIVRVYGRVINQIEQQLVSDLSGLDNVQVLRNSYNINCYVGDSQDYCSVEEILEVPTGKATIKEILRSDVKISGKEFKITENKVIAKGELNISTLYIGDDELESIQFMEHEVPFTQVIDFPGITEESTCEVKYRVADSQFEPEEDGDGELRSIRAQVSVGISVDVYEKRSMEVIADAYSPDVRLDVEKQSFRTEEFVEEGSYQISFKKVFEIDEESPEIQEVFNVLCKANLSEYKIYDGRVVLEGVTNNNVLYLAESDEQPVFCLSGEVPFEEEIEIPALKEDMRCEIDVDVEHCTYSMLSSKEVEVRTVLSASLKVVKEVDLPLIEKVEETPLDLKRLEDRPSIVIYFVQEGDTLWDLAKRYYTTIEDLKRANDMGDDDSIVVGQQIIIPKRKVN